MQRLSDISQKALDYCREMFYKDSRLDNLDELSTGFGRTPLHIAVLSGDKTFARDILSSRPNLAVKQDNQGWTPLHLASARASLKMVKLLLKDGPNACMVKDKDERTPLHLAAMNDRIDIMEVLMEKRSEAIHLKKQDGETILHFCDKTVLKLAAEMKKIENEIETRFLKFNAHDTKKHMSTLPKNGDEHKGMNPPGGVWQDDSKIDSGIDPVTFAYYVDHMFGSSTFGSSISGGLDRYIQAYLHSSYINSSYYIDRYNSTIEVEEERIYPIYIEYLVKDLTDMYMDEVYHNMTLKGLVLEDFIFTDILSYYNNSAINSSRGDFFPYLILNYVIYIVTNGVALFVSLAIIFLVVCGFMIETTVNQVRTVVVLMCISIGCIVLGYMSILLAMLPDFYMETNATFIILQVFFGICCVLGVGSFIWTLARKTIKLQKRRRHQHTEVISYLKAIFFAMDAKAAGKVILFTVSYFVFCLNGYIYYGSWSRISGFLF
ncbi:hypothetical protein MKX01_023620 [Papaver californicum]|nr:hypothetical protein MKX01_023620 [Papaver californicum]